MRIVRPIGWDQVPQVKGKPPTSLGERVVHGSWSLGRRGLRHPVLATRALEKHGRVICVGKNESWICRQEASKRETCGIDMRRVRVS